MAEAFPRITLVTPSYNQGAYLRATLESVLSQGYPNLEYIVMDGGSRDDSADILRAYAPRLTYWQSAPDEGQADAINKGLRRSTGDILGWLNSDDVLLPGTLHAVARYFRLHPQHAIVTGLRKVIGPDGRFLYNSFKGLPTPAALRYVCNVHQEATFWRREVYTTVGELDSRLQYALDYDYWRRMLAAGYTFAFVFAYWGGFRVHPQSKGQRWEQVRAAELRALYQRDGTADDEEDALDRLSAQEGDWRQKLRLYRDLGHQPISDRPGTFWWAERLLRPGGAMRLLLALHRRYRAGRLAAQK